jgi:hypothetical protein
MADRERFIESLYRRGGLRNGQKGALYVAKWLIAAEVLGPELTIEECYEWWLESESTAYRGRAALRACLAEGVSVDDVLAWAWSNGKARQLARREKRTGSREKGAVSVVAGLSVLPFELGVT